MDPQKYRPGDWVIYRMTKFSEHPGPRAANVNPSPRGDEYNYTIDKFWIVREVQPDGSLVLQTRRGKSHVVSPTDRQLRKANWWERWCYRARFKELPNVSPAAE